jgi:hypothetical protein
MSHKKKIEKDVRENSSDCATICIFCYCLLWLKAVMLTEWWSFNRSFCNCLWWRTAVGELHRMKSGGQVHWDLMGDPTQVHRSSLSFEITYSTLQFSVFQIVKIWSKNACRFTQVTAYVWKISCSTRGWIVIWIHVMTTLGHGLVFVLQDETH